MSKNPRYDEWCRNNRERRAQHSRNYRARGGWRVERARNVAKGKITGRIFHVVIVGALRELIKESRKARTAFQRQLAEIERKERKAAEKIKRVFLCKIFQPGICVDCGTDFETLFPPEQIAFGVVNPCGVIRCRACARQRRLKNHGGGPRRRCAQFGVPYETINPGSVFRKDDYKCRICGGNLDMSAESQHPKAAQIDHIIPLSAPGSLGHVLSNVQSAHRECNIRKGARYGESPNEGFAIS